jgi:23S rRNA-/tRNA-specific pseudouridylate synthase
LVSEGESLVALLERLNQSDALVAGRVFVNGRRAEADVSLEVGARVDVYAARGDAAAVSILARHRGLVFAEKPVGIATEPERRGSEHTLLHRVAELLSVQPARVNALTRLDVGVSGVVLLALDAEARQRVQALRAAGAFERGYVALASAAPGPDAGSWNAAIGRDNSGPRRALDRNGDPAETR